jgi:hypothetical protein
MSLKKYFRRFQKNFLKNFKKIVMYNKYNKINISHSLKFFILIHRFVGGGGKSLTGGGGGGPATSSAAFSLLFWPPEPISEAEEPSPLTLELDEVAGKAGAGRGLSATTTAPLLPPVLFPESCRSMVTCSVPLISHRQNGQVLSPSGDSSKFFI